MFQMIVAWKYSEFLNREKRMKVLEQGWNVYRSKVMPVDCSTVQIQETRRAFYAGAGELLDSMLKLFGPGAEPTESDMLIMDGIKAELTSFAKDIQEGRA